MSISIAGLYAGLQQRIDDSIQHGGFTPPRLLNFLTAPELTLADAEDIWEKMEVDEPSARDPFGRIMYHTFNSAATWSDFSCRDAQFQGHSAVCLQMGPTF